MAKRKEEIIVKSIVGNLYEAWMDDGVADDVRHIPGVYEVYQKRGGGAPWGIKIDPRYDADEVIAEIEVLGKETRQTVFDRCPRPFERHMTYQNEVLLAGIKELRGHVGAFSERVAPLYVLLNWTWTNTRRSPKAADIAAVLHRLLDGMASEIEEDEVHDGWYIATGGLKVSYDGYQFTMAFEVDESIVCGG